MTTRPGPFDPYMPQFGCLCVILALCSLCLLPFIYFDVMEKALANLHLQGPIATLTIFGIIVGSLINLPLYRVDRETEQPVMRGYMVPGLGWVPLSRRGQQTVVAVNVGGCLIPTALAIFEASLVWRVSGQQQQVVWALVLAVIVNIGACFWLARPIRGVGIAIPAFLPPLLAVGMAWLLLNGDQYNNIRAPVAYVAGVAGPLIGADLLNLRRFERLHTGIISIGGAGTFDGIVISGIMAAFFA